MATKGPRSPVRDSPATDGARNMQWISGKAALEEGLERLVQRGDHLISAVPLSYLLQCGYVTHPDGEAAERGERGVEERPDYPVCAGYSRRCG